MTTPHLVFSKLGAIRKPEHETDRSRFELKKEARDALRLGRVASRRSPVRSLPSQSPPELRRTTDSQIDNVPSKFFWLARRPVGQLHKRTDRPLICSKKELSESIPHVPLEMLHHGFDRCAILVEVSEQQPALQRGHDDSRAGAGVALGKFTLSYSARDYLLKASNELRHRLACRIAQFGVAVVAFDGEVHNRTAAVECFVVRGLAKHTEKREEPLGGTQEAITRPRDGVSKASSVKVVRLLKCR